MGTNLKTIIKSAIKEERYFMEYYKKAAAKTDIMSAKDLLTKLSLQEKGHKERLEALDIGRLDGKTLPGKLEAIQLHDDLLLTPISELKGLKEVFALAIRAEAAAQEMYKTLAKSVDDTAAKSLFTKLALEEKSHEALLRKELLTLGI